MKVHYVNIFLFALPLNILANNNNKPYVTLCHRPTTRLLCECELYSPQNYENDPEMKTVMQNFDRQTSQQFHEYNERMHEKRKKCTEQCDKDIQKIILKDKIERELLQHLSTLETNIETNDIPTCVCEKALADKVEKTCLRCEKNLGGIVPGLGLLGGAALYSIKVWKPVAIKAAIAAAAKSAAVEGTKDGIDYGMKYIISELKRRLFINSINSSTLEKAITAEMLNNHTLIIESVNTHYKMFCGISGYGKGEAFCDVVGEEYSVAKGIIDKTIKNIVGDAKRGADVITTQVTADTFVKLKEAETAAIEASSVTYNIAITASVVAILIIVLVMVIIYLILRHRRKKKLKKKLEYIKLLNQ
ncbi:PIR protein, putative [Plasmodium sp.]|nr:PIR protein, putative [Plasmodium sp.]